MNTPTARTTGEITVHHCTVTVVRRGGWSWGPDPRAVVDEVIGSLPELLADHFAEQLAGDGPDMEITEPMTVTVRPGRPGWTGPGRMPVEVHFAPAEMVEISADASAAGAPVAGAEAFEGFFERSFEESFGVAVRPWPAPSVAALFAELAERNELDALLALLPDDSVRVYLLALLGDGNGNCGADGNGSADGDGDATAGRLLAELAGRALLNTSTEEMPAALRGLLRGDPPDGDTTALARLLTEYLATADRNSLCDPSDLSDPSGRSGSFAEEPSPATGGALVPRTTGEVRVWSALPFLLAGPLARIGYLDAIGPALAGLELAEEAPLFAAALAYKVLGVTGRGWRRTEQDSEAAAAFAGLGSPVPEDRLTGFARVAAPAFPVLDGVLALSVCRGHDPAAPLLITGAEDRLLLADAQGMFPIAWAATIRDLLPYWQACGRPYVLICDGPLPTGSLGELATAGVPFMTGIRPLRGDPVTRLPWRTPLWKAPGARVDVRLAAELPGHTARLTDLVTVLAVERRAAPLARDGGLERTVTLAAALGLSTLAWTLWRDRETPDPLLALSRFADLDATVRFEPTAVRVRVPLGRRHTDLLRGGLLADVPDVVWLGGRTLTFSGG
ncbi:hypothetical protein ACIOJD_14750 [Streptomyces sp. NPDC088116]|uniref:hypothetical protein n=1 Tax=Streptomyces sp. NPDC088116 TaxID=3365825 RepID=UPI0038054C40